MAAPVPMNTNRAMPLQGWEGRRAVRVGRRAAGCAPERRGGTACCGGGGTHTNSAATWRGLICIRVLFSFTLFPQLAVHMAPARGPRVEPGEGSSDATASAGESVLPAQQRPPGCLSGL